MVNFITNWLLIRGWFDEFVSFGMKFIVFGKMSIYSSTIIKTKFHPSVPNDILNIEYDPKLLPVISSVFFNKK